MANRLMWLAAFWLGIGVLAAAPASAQWHVMNLAVRTSGSIQRPGDCLRVELIALDTIQTSFSYRVYYRFTESVVVKDKDGAERRESRAGSVDRPLGPVIEQLNPLQSVLLDDTFCFGQSTPPGRYVVEVSLFQSGSSSLGSLRSCVQHDPGTPAGTAEPCPLFLSGVARADSSSSFVFNGRFPASGRYRAVVVRGNHAEALIDNGVYVSGTNELTIDSPLLWRGNEEAIDIVVHDQVSGQSTTLSRLTLWPPR